MFNLNELIKVVSYEDGNVIDTNYVCADENPCDIMSDVAAAYIDWQGAKVIEQTDKYIILDNSEDAGCESIITIKIED